MILGINLSFAQGFAGASFNIGFPYNEFAAVHPNVGVGFDVTVQKQIGLSPILSIGGMADWLLIDSHRSSFTLFNYETRVYEDYNVITNSNTFGLYAVARLQIPDVPITPYAEFFGGFRTFYTRTKVELDTPDGDVKVDQSTNQISFTTSYGAEGGLAIGLSEEFQITVGVRYLKGGNTKYVDTNTISQTQGTAISYSTKESATDLLIPSLGFMAYFD